MTGFVRTKRGGGTGSRRARMWVSLLLSGIALLTPGTVPAVVILDGAWREEGGARGREAEGFGVHIRLAHEPQFRALVTLSYDGGETWGDGSGTWIGNDESYGYVLTSAHNFDDSTVDEVVFRTDGGSALRGNRVWIHPKYNSKDDRTGVDAAIVRLVRPVRDAGPAPVLYAGRAEKGKTITFVGFGTRGIGSVGENERYNKGSDKAAAQGVVEEATSLRRASDDDDDLGNYLTVFLPREDGRIENPFGGARRPVSRLAGLLGAGDSGGSAWMPLGDGWVIAGINTSGDGKAQYGDSSWFVRVSGIRSWIASVFPGARFMNEHDPAPERPAVDAPVVSVSSVSAPVCDERKRFFVFSDGAWYPARVRGPGDRPGACQVHFDGFSSDLDEAVDRRQMLPWKADGPGTEIDDCRPGMAVVAEEDEVWYPATIRKARGRGCTVRYADEDYDDENLPLSRLRTMR